jgi:membrane protease YdiL (CAAX protease family)
MDQVKILAVFFLGAYGFTWTVHYMLIRFKLPANAAGGRGIYAIGLLGPLLSATATSYWFGGTAATLEVFSRATRWRFSVTWYVVALLSTGVVQFLGLTVCRLACGRPRLPWLKNPGDPWWAILCGQFYVVVAEEFGWRAFALPRLIRAFGSGGAVVLLGLLWSGWHLPMFFVPGSHQTGSFLSYVLRITSATAIMTLLFQKTGGSILPCMLYHAALNTWYFVSLPKPGARPYIAALHNVVLLLAMVFLQRPLFRIPF